VRLLYRLDIPDILPDGKPLLSNTSQKYNTNNNMLTVSISHHFVSEISGAYSALQAQTAEGSIRHPQKCTQLTLRVKKFLAIYEL